MRASRPALLSAAAAISLAPMPLLSPILSASSAPRATIIRTNALYPSVAASSAVFGHKGNFLLLLEGRPRVKFGAALYAPDPPCMSPAPHLEARAWPPWGSNSEPFQRVGFCISPMPVPRKPSSSKPVQSEFS